METVKTHVVNAKDKLGAADRTQVAVIACSVITVVILLWLPTLDP